MNALYIQKSFLRVIPLFVVTLLHAQPAATTLIIPAPLGLLRLKDNPKPGDAAKLVANKFAIDDLSPSGVVGASKSKNGDVDVLALEGGKEWSRPLRGAPRDVAFISFQLYISQSTIVDIAGVRLGVTAGPVPDSLQLMFDNSATGTLQWKSLNVHVGTGKYGGKNLVALSTLTVRLDPVASTWDLFSGSRLLADNLPLIAAKKDDRRFVVRAGSDGAWITGLVMADENPLYEDANANGIDDVFERQTRGGLLATNAPLADRQLLAQQWKEAQRRKPPPALHVNRPMPDRAVR